MTAALLRFAVVAAFVPVAELVPLARAADGLGYDALCLGDHVVDIETIETPYPYTSSGDRRWDTAMECPDPWVMAGNLAAVTQRLSFFTSIYVAAMRNPYVVAKAVGTAAVVSGGRVKLGVGVGWCREEFELLEADFSTRGKRTDEALALLRRLWTEPWVSSEGPFYPAPKLTMRPLPPAEVPILVGGLSDVAIRDPPSGTQRRLDQRHHGDRRRDRRCRPARGTAGPRGSPRRGRRRAQRCGGAR